MKCAFYGIGKSVILVALCVELKRLKFFTLFQDIFGVLGAVGKNALPRAELEYRFGVGVAD